MTVRPEILLNALSVSTGGGRSYVLNLLRELRRDDRGFRFTVLAEADQLSAEETAGLDRITPRLPRKPRTLRLLARLAYEVVMLPRVARRFDLLYCLADLSPIYGATPTVVALRNLNIYDRTFYQTLRLRLLRALVQAGLPRARRVLFPSRAAAELVRREIRLPEERVAVVPHGIALDAFDAVPDEPPPAAPYVFLPAALERHKNIATLIEAVPLLRDTGIEAWIAGSEATDPAHAAELRRLVVARGLERRVRFLGSVPYRQILKYYRAAQALVFPSRLETFGHPLLEAMLTGTPIIAADIPAFREIAAEVAVYFDPDSPAELAKAVDHVLADASATRERVGHGRLRVREFSWGRSIDRLCAVFDEALGRR